MKNRPSINCYASSFVYVCPRGAARRPVLYFLYDFITIRIRDPESEAKAPRIGASSQGNVPKFKQNGKWNTQLEIKAMPHQSSIMFAFCLHFRFQFQFRFRFQLLLDFSFLDYSLLLFLFFRFFFFFADSHKLHRNILRSSRFSLCISICISHFFFVVFKHTPDSQTQCAQLAFNCWREKKSRFIYNLFLGICKTFGL